MTQQKLPQKGSICKHLTLKVKNEALKEFEKGMPSKGVAKQFSIPGSTFATWKKNKEKSLKLFKFITETTKSENWNIRKVR